MSFSLAHHLAGSIIGASVLWSATSFIPADAALVVASDTQFGWATDTATGLDWLSFTGGPHFSNVGISYDLLTHPDSLLFGPGGFYSDAGWRVATRAEVRGFVASVSGVAYGVEGASTAYQGITDLVAAYVGYTGHAEGQDLIYGFTSEEVSCPGLVNCEQYLLALRDPNDTIGSNPFISFPDVDFYNNELSRPTYLEPIPNVGTWMVRESTLAVPEPSTLALAAAAVLLLVSSHRRASRPRLVC